MEEIWKDINGYEGIYQISSIGRVKSLERISIQNHLIKEKILRYHVNISGYHIVDTYKDGKRRHNFVHKLVAEHFVDNPRKLTEVDHIDTVKSNNSYTNLRWCTHSENHLNILTVKLKSENMKGRKIPREIVEK